MLPFKKLFPKLIPQMLLPNKPHEMLGLLESNNIYFALNTSCQGTIVIIINFSKMAKNTVRL